MTPIVVTEMLGAPTFLDEEMEERTKDPGVAIGLAWTPAGGDVLFIEVSRMAGAGTLTITGQLGDVMKESARAALSWFRAHAATYGADPEFFKNAELICMCPRQRSPRRVRRLRHHRDGSGVRVDEASGPRGHRETGEITL